MASKKLIYWLIPLIILLLWWGWQTDAFASMADTVKGMVKVSVGTEELEGVEPTIPSDHEAAINKLVATIEKMKDAKGTNCFANYKLKDYGTGSGLPDLGEKGTSISFKWDEDNKFTRMRIGGGAGGDQDIGRLYKEIEGFRPCVIAGGSAAEVFYYNFLKERIEKGGERKIPGDYYSEVQNVQIAYDGENEITHDSGISDLEDGGWLFKAEDGIVCFFPTFDGLGGCNGNENGLDDVCTLNAEKESIPNRWKDGTLEKCIK